VVELEERRRKRIHERPPCNPTNAPDPEALLQTITKRKGLVVIGFLLQLMCKGEEHLVDCRLRPQRKGEFLEEKKIKNYGPKKKRPVTLSV
jgi:hypothetical protein